MTVKKGSDSANLDLGRYFNAPLPKKFYKIIFSTEKKLKKFKKQCGSAVTRAEKAYFEMEVLEGESCKIK